MISIRKQVISVGNSLPYWGCAFLHNFKEDDIEAAHPEKCFRDRLVLLSLSVQPFEHSSLGNHVYLMGSLCCAAGYANDAHFSEWGKIKTNKENNLNNSFLEESIPIDAVTVQGFIAWLKSCPVWLIITKSIKFGCEILTNYELNSNIEDESRV